MQSETVRTVLIIDDNEDDIEITSHVLDRLGWGIRIESARSGEDGLVRLSQGGSEPDLVLLDLKMRGVDGIEVLRRVRADRRLQTLPVVILTHSALSQDVEAVVRAGATAVMHKTVDVAQFQEEVRDRLEPWLNPAFKEL